MKPGREASRVNIVEALDFLARSAQANPGAKLLLLFSGHGSYTRDRDDDEPLDKADETIVPADGRVGGVQDITDDYIKIILDKIIAASRGSLSSE